MVHPESGSILDVDIPIEIPDNRACVAAGADLYVAGGNIYNKSINNAWKISIECAINELKGMP